MSGCNYCEYYDRIDKYCTKEDVCYLDGYNKAINDYNEALHEEIGKYQFPVEKIDEIADRLKRWWDNAK